MENEYAVLIFFSLLIILSYFFNLIAQIIRVPSVLLLIFTGISVRLLVPEIANTIQGLDKILSLVGTLGLILIVLEGSLELELGKKKIPLIASSFFRQLLYC